MDELQAAFEDTMHEMRGPLKGTQGALIPAVAWADRWRRVSRTAAQLANTSIQKRFLPAFTGATMSRDESGRFAKLMTIDQTDYPLFTRWFNSLRKFAQTMILQQWAPIRAPFFSRSQPQLRVEVNPREVNHFDVTDQTEDIVIDAMCDALVEDAEIWVGPIIQDFVSKKPYNTFH